jgi:hypothetical protein
MNIVRKAFALFAVAGLIAVAVASADPGHRLPLTARHGGRDIVQWQRAWAQWALGGAGNPIAHGLCGEEIDGLFFLSSALGPGTTFECDVPPGSKLLVTAGMGFFEMPTFGATDEEIIAVARQSWEEQVLATSLTVDGRAVEVEAATREAGAYTIQAAPGSLYVDEFGFDPGSIRLASIGQFVILQPLQPGDHEIVAVLIVDLGGGETLTLDSTFVVHVN